MQTVSDLRFSHFEASLPVINDSSLMLGLDPDGGRYTKASRGALIRHTTPGLQSPGETHPYPLPPGFPANRGRVSG